MKLKTTILLLALLALLAAALLALNIDRRLSFTAAADHAFKQSLRAFADARTGSPTFPTTLGDATLAAAALEKSAHRGIESDAAAALARMTEDAARCRQAVQTGVSPDFACLAQQNFDYQQAIRKIHLIYPAWDPPAYTANLPIDARM